MEIYVDGIIYFQAGGIFLEKRIRKPNRLREYDYRQDGVYFITICTQNREPVLSEIAAGVGDGFPVPVLKPAGNIVQKYLNHLHEKYPMVCVDYFVIMPNHVHVLLSVSKDNVITGSGNQNERGHLGGTEPLSPTLGNIIGWFKYQTTKEINMSFGMPGMRIWQRSYYDHVIRDEDDYWNIWQYIEENPARWLEKLQS